jgi:hypothetical protein
LGRFSDLETALWTAAAAVSLLAAAWAVRAARASRGLAAPTERVWPAVAAGVVLAVTAAVALGSVHVR